ncbi:hypothetical protein N7507_007828 [Penicillium longicatenatum]|nr:hypothetical protein N7507_007828 [Penicillium longicatenatum]
MPSLTSRYYCNGWDNDCNNSSWDRWGRWVAFAVIVAIAFLVFFAFACFNARRRRSHGQQPYSGTAWMAPPPGPPPPNQPTYQQPYYNNNDPYYQPPPSTLPTRRTTATLAPRPRPSTHSRMASSCKRPKIRITLPGPENMNPPRVRPRLSHER